MAAHLRLKSVSVPEPNGHGGYIAVVAATYGDGAGLCAGTALPAVPFENRGPGAWTWTFDGDGPAIRDYADVPPECNWVVVVANAGDEHQARQLLQAVEGSVTAMAHDARSKSVDDIGSVLATGIEAVIDHLFFEPKRLGTFVGSAGRGELLSPWTRTEDQVPQSAAITLAWDVEPAAQLGAAQA